MLKRHYRSFLLQRVCPLLLGAGILAFYGSLAARPALVCLVKSEQREEYEQTSKALVSELADRRDEVTIEESLLGSDGDAEGQFWDSVKARQPEMIVTVGPLATRSAVQHINNIPIIFTLVLDNPADLHSNPVNQQLNGVSLTIPVEEQLKLIKEALPDVRRVGLLYSQHSDTMYQAARKAAQKTGLRLVAAEVATERDIPSALRKILPQIDAFWMPPDDVVYDSRFPHILRFILLECFQNSVPVVAMSVHMATAGAPLALGIDYEDLGRQTAELVMKKLTGRTLAGNLVENPRKVVIYINEWVASSLGLKIPRKVIDQAVPVKSGR